MITTENLFLPFLTTRRRNNKKGGLIPSRILILCLMCWLNWKHTHNQKPNNENGEDEKKWQHNFITRYYRDASPTLSHPHHQTHQFYYTHFAYRFGSMACPNLSLTLQRALTSSTMYILYLYIFLDSRESDRNKYLLLDPTFYLVWT